MAERQICQWDKDSCADAGFLKIDLLGLGMLSAVEECVDQIARHTGETVDLSRIPLDDPEVYAEVQLADTVGTFQIESRAQMQMLLRTRPETLDDLTVEVALVRPGPIQGGAVHPYLHRREALRADPAYVIPYDHPLLEEPLRDTLGVIVYQDQVLDVAVALAGFTQGQAEGLRRAMSRRRSREALASHWYAFRDGAAARGVDEAVANLVFEQILAFSAFGFPKSHAAAFGLLAYQSAWLHRHHPAAFLSALLNAQPLGFYPPATLVRDGMRRGVEVRKIDVERLVRQLAARGGRRGPARPAPHPRAGRAGGRAARRRAGARRPVSRSRRPDPPHRARPPPPRAPDRGRRLRRDGPPARAALAARAARATPSPCAAATSWRSTWRSARPRALRPSDAGRRSWPTTGRPGSVSGNTLWRSCAPA